MHTLFATWARGISARTTTLGIAVLALLSFGIASSSPAVADTAPGQVTFIDHELNTDPAAVGRINGTPGYQQVVSRIRSAAGHTMRDDVLMTQNYTGGVIGLVIRNHRGVELVTLYINPRTVHIAGFQTRDNHSYYFEDAPGYIVTEINRHARTFGSDARRLFLSGNYFDWEQVVIDSGMTRTEYPNVDSFASEASALGNMSTEDAISRSYPQICHAMMLMDAAYIAAAQITDFRDAVSPGMRDLYSRTSDNVVSITLREWRSPYYQGGELPQGWDRMPAYLSRWGYRDGAQNDIFDTSANLPAPIRVGPWNGTLNTWNDLRTHYRLIVHPYS